ncbi:MAG: TIGR04282 family arsenosugar biosynthesis glycosyltransferase, partial [Gammaproteobacteria bacterium]|nr:TIGR04282 family arsenosugar biosynthesis glycosyltransferase [Gammaproteobacteria bacterium]
MHKDKVLIIFAKAPVAGSVKTRLIPEFSASQAASIHRQLLEYLLTKLVSLQQINIELHCAPNSHHEFFQSLQKQFPIKLKNQSSGDLGQRMYNAISEALTEYKNVILIGSDSPAINSEYIQQAFIELKDTTTVIGPAEDGGYVLVGTNRLNKELFKNIDWGSNDKMGLLMAT